MPDSSVEESTELGYQAPRNTQFSVFLDNRVGKLLELVQIFEGQATQLAALSVIDSADHAVVRIITSRGDLTRRLLQRHNLPFSEKEVLVVELSPSQTLSKICLCLLSAELNIHYSYPVMVRPHGRPAIALQCDDQVLAAHILIRKHFVLLAENDLGDNATNSDEADGDNN